MDLKITNDIQIRFAKINDINSIQNLNKKWTVQSLDVIEKENGFLYRDTYNSADLIEIIDA